MDAGRTNFATNEITSLVANETPCGIDGQIFAVLVSVSRTNNLRRRDYIGTGRYAQIGRMVTGRATQTLHDFIAGTPRDGGTRIIGSARVTNVLRTHEAVDFLLRKPVFGSLYQGPLRLRPQLQTFRMVEPRTLIQRTLLSNIGTASRHAVVANETIRIDIFHTESALEVFRIGINIFVGQLHLLRYLRLFTLSAGSAPQAFGIDGFYAICVCGYVF